MMGAPGKHTFAFKANGASGCQEELTLAYARPGGFPGFDKWAGDVKKINVKVMPEKSAIKYYKWKDLPRDDEKVVTMQVQP